MMLFIHILSGLTNENGFTVFSSGCDLFAEF